MTNREIIRQLEALGEAYRKKYASSPEEIERSLVRFQSRLAEYKAAHPQTERAPSTLTVIFRVVTALPQFFVPAPVRMMARPALGFAVVAVLVLGGLNAASGQTGPGHLFYGLKRATERAQLTFALDPRAKARLQLELAGRRLDEAASLLEQDTPASDQRLGQAVSAVTEQLSNAQTQLESLPEQDQGAVDLAKYVDRKASDYRRVLRDAARSAPRAVQNETEAASQAAHDISIAAVTRLLKEQKNDGLVSLGDAERRVREKLRELEETIQMIAVRLSALPGGPYPEVLAVGGPTYGALLLDLDRAREKLEAGKNLLARGGFEAALAAYREGVSLTNHLEAALGLYEKNVDSNKSRE